MGPCRALHRMLSALPVCCLAQEQLAVPGPTKPISAQKPLGKGTPLPGTPVAPKPTPVGSPPSSKRAASQQQLVPTPGSSSEEEEEKLEQELEQAPAAATPAAKKAKHTEAFAVADAGKEQQRGCRMPSLMHLHAGMLACTHACCAVQGRVKRRSTKKTSTKRARKRKPNR